MKRLVVETDDAFERALLKSARSEAVPRHGARNAAIALAAAAQHFAAPGAAVPIDPSAVGTGAALAAKAGAAGMWKWLGIGVAIGSLAGAGATMALQRLPAAPNGAMAAAQPGAPDRPGAAQPATVAVAPAASAPSPVAAEPAAEEQVAVAPSARATARARAEFDVAPGAPNTAEPASPAAAASAREIRSTLAAEAAAIDRARRALAAGAPDRAIALLDRYERESPTHMLAPDAQALRVQAEKARGNDALAKQLAERFLNAHPNDPHADRVRRTVSAPPRP
jgi:hypothetical protein